ncbi:phosphatase PAP2 family protein [Microlunatus ginsengisoli]|uniref:Phosphatase PAP2 family protein n=1 Tax=Microlunatus ginsengisoli TaxID=363863 RepID=A0ABP7ADY8_9ACTN
MTMLLDRLRRADHAVYRLVADTSTPALDRPLQLISDFANHSKPWFLTAAALAAFGGRRGRRAAITGVLAIGATSFVVNQPMKRARRRVRPDRIGLGVPESRWVDMPGSTSFPSGHSASAAAFAMSVGHLVPALRLPLRLAAGTVAFSRVYTGVHFPGDVAVGVAVGAAVGVAAGRLAARVKLPWPGPPDAVRRPPPPDARSYARGPGR